ncbi:hypothetical protein D3C75_1233750 [compost metagenome]
MRQYQRIRQPVGNVEVPTQRIRQGMHRRHRRIGECLAGKTRTQQHGLARD